MAKEKKLTIRDIAEKIVCFELAAKEGNNQFCVTMNVIGKIAFLSDGPYPTLYIGPLTAPLDLEATRQEERFAVFELGNAWLTLWWDSGVNYKSPEARERWTGV